MNTLTYCANYWMGHGYCDHLGLD